jgi:2-octaprenyl-6-methoxyphenol hydroxylase
LFKPGASGLRRLAGLDKHRLRGLPLMQTHGFSDTTMPRATDAQRADAPSPDTIPLVCDILVIGGGLAGSSLAIACASAGIDVVLVDRVTPVARTAEPFDGKTYAIAYGSKRILDGIGLWQHVESEAQPILEIRVADNNAPLFLHYNHREVGDDPLGWIVESRWLRQAAFERIRELPHLTQIAPASATSILRQADGVTATLSTGQVVKARLLVSAEGRGSTIRQDAGIRALKHDYGQDGIVCTVAHEQPHRGIAVEHFMPSGPFAILPMTGDRSSIVWTERSAISARMVALPRLEFDREVARRFGDFLGAIETVGPIYRYPLSIELPQRIIDRRLALLGDAAHGVHPIAGQGLNLGIRDVAALAELVVDARRLGLDPGSADVLARYQRARRFDILALSAVTDGMNRLFSNDIAPIRAIRDIGLAVVNTAPLTPVRKLLMKHAMGVLGKQPRLTRGLPL